MLSSCMGKNTPEENYIGSNGGGVRHRAHSAFKRLLNGN